MKNLISILILSVPLCMVACSKDKLAEDLMSWYPTGEEWDDHINVIVEEANKSKIESLINIDSTNTFGQLVATHADVQTLQNTVYDGSWVNIGYPGGDPGYQQGVCTDVVIRAYRFINIDFQELIHEDMKIAHSEYNKRYLTKKLDNNIDHRRTQNIQTYLTRIGAKISVPKVNDYKPGDIVFWDIAAGHTGIVSDKKSLNHGGYMVIHNIGGGAEIEDLLYTWTPMEVYRLNDDHVNKLQENCTFEYSYHEDFKRYVK